MSNIKYYRYDWIWKNSLQCFSILKIDQMQATENISVFSLAKWGHSSSQLKEHRMNYYPVERK